MIIISILVLPNEYRNPWYNDENRAKTINDNMKIQIFKESKERKLLDMNKKSVNDFSEVFRNLNNREPMENEILDNLKDKIDIVTIKKILDENKLNNLNDSIV